MSQRRTVHRIPSTGQGLLSDRQKEFDETGMVAKFAVEIPIVDKQWNRDCRMYGRLVFDHTMGSNTLRMVAILA